VRGLRPWRTLWGRLALGTIAGLLTAAVVVGATASGLAQRQGERAARTEFDRQAVEIGKIASRQAQSAIERGVEVNLPNLQALVGEGTLVRHTGLPLNQGGREPFDPLPQAIADRTDTEIIEAEGIQRIDFVRGDGTRIYATAVPLLYDGIPTGSIVVSRPASEFDVSLNDVLPRVAIALGAGLVVALIIILTVTRLATRPLREMEDATVEVAGGNLGITLARGGPEELDTLAGAFNEMVAQLRQRDSMTRDFLMQITHDLRTPLTAIQGHAAALADGVVPAEQRGRSIDAIGSEAARLDHLVADLLDLARLQAHRFRLDLGEVDIAHLVTRALEAFTATATQNGISFERDVASLPNVVTDGARVHQIVANLLENAFRWTPEGGTVRVKGTAEPGGLELSVSDTGPGIPAANLETVFEPFRSEATPNGLRGTGLGLAISRELARALGGDLTVESEEGRGSRFTLQLPAEASVPAPATAG
jgi:two-component system, OmpR family, sensor kinase